jgi:prepilin-type N-terminal cleavage/methylation domain-containing protein
VGRLVLYRPSIFRYTEWMRQKGYTLVEVLIVVAIMAILIGIGMAAYGRFDRVRKVEQSALGFGMYLRATQKMADSGDKPMGCIGLNGFQVVVNTTADSGTALLTALCSISLPQVPKSLKNNTIFEDDFWVTFNSVGRGVSVGYNPGDGETVISDSAASARYRIVVNSGGAITVEKI